MPDSHPAARRELLTVAALLTYVVVQVAIPAAHLRFPYATPFAWKMFAYFGSAPVELRLILADGRTQEWKPDPSVAAVRRSEINRARVLPPALCRRLPTVRAVESRTPPDITWRRFECR